MQQGMLWYDEGEESEMRERISRAVKFFQSKYGYLPRVCYVHPEELEAGITVDEQVKIEPNARMIKHHIWLEFPEE